MATAQAKERSRAEELHGRGLEGALELPERTSHVAGVRAGNDERNKM